MDTKTTRGQSAYNKMERFAWLTIIALQRGNDFRAQKCLDAAESLLHEGSMEMKNAVKNVYLFTVSSFLEARRIAIRGLLPQALLSEYERQVNTSGV